MVLQIAVGDVGEVYKVRLIVDGKGATTAINMLKVCTIHSLSST